MVENDAFGSRVLALSTGTSSLFIDIVSQSGERETSERVDQYKRKGEKRSLIHHVTSKKSGLFWYIVE